MVTTLQMFVPTVIPSGHQEAPTGVLRGFLERPYALVSFIAKVPTDRVPGHTCVYARCPGRFLV